MDQQKIENTFKKALDQVDTLSKAFEAGSAFEQAVEAIGGDIAWFEDVRKGLEGLWDTVEDAHRGALGHMDESMEAPRARHMTLAEAPFDGPRVGRKLQALAVKEPNDMIANAMANVADHLEDWGTPFGPKSMGDLVKKTGLTPEIIKMIIARANKVEEGVYGKKDPKRLGEATYNFKTPKGYEIVDMSKPGHFQVSTPAGEIYADYDAESEMFTNIESPDGIIQDFLFPDACKKDDMHACISNAVDKTLKNTNRLGEARQIDWPYYGMEDHAYNAIRHDMHAYDAFDHVFSMAKDNYQRDWLKDNKDDIIKMFASYGLQTESKIAEAKKAKPDYLDLDKDGNRKEPMKKAADDKEDKKVKEAKKPTAPKPRDPNSQYMNDLRKSGAMGAHKDKKKMDKIPRKAKHKGKAFEAVSNPELDNLFEEIKLELKLRGM